MKVIQAHPNISLSILGWLLIQSYTFGTEVSALQTNQQNVMSDIAEIKEDLNSLNDKIDATNSALAQTNNTLVSIQTALNIKLPELDQKLDAVISALVEE